MPCPHGRKNLFRRLVSSCGKVIQSPLDSSRRRRYFFRGVQRNWFHALEKKSFIQKRQDKLLRVLAVTKSDLLHFYFLTAWYF